MLCTTSRPGSKALPHLHTLCAAGWLNAEALRQALDRKPVQLLLDEVPKGIKGNKAPSLLPPTHTGPSHEWGGGQPTVSHEGTELLKLFLQELA